jgi:two-component system sensor histidine kinase BarA
VPETIEGDPVRLNQIISNLVSNALKFTQQGSVVIAARCVPMKDGALVVEFSVADTGIGIAADKQAAIFEAFSQADQSTTRKFGGTGLGLAICRRLVEAMGGSLGVTSREGKGSRFHFTVPTRELEPSRPVTRSPEERRAVIALAGSATPIMLARYLEEAGISAQIVTSESPIEQSIAYADMIFASPDYLRALARLVGGDPGEWIPARVCISELGDLAPDGLLRDGIAEDLLIKPLSRRDVFDQLDRIFEGRLRGKDALREIDPGASTTPTFPGARVLAADDSPVNREVVREALTRLGVTPVLAADGAEVVAALKRERFDLILMDCSMPVMDGFEATRAIRRLADKGLAATPIIALTAHVEGEGEEWRKAGMNDYMTKPFTLATLAAAIGRLIKPSGATPSPAPEKMKLPAAFSRFNEETLAGMAAMQSGSGDLIVRALGLFETHSRAAMLRLANAVKARDTKEIASAAHALKSMCFNVGAQTLGEAAREIERHAAELPSLPPYLKKAREEYAATMAELPQVRAQYRRKAA